MNGADLLARSGMSRLRADGRLQVIDDSSARIAVWRDVSPVRAASLSQVFKRFIRQRIQAPFGNIPFNLPVPIGSL